MCRELILKLEKEKHIRSINSFCSSNTVDTTFESRKISELNLCWIFVNWGRFLTFPLYEGPWRWDLEDEIFGYFWKFQFFWGMKHFHLHSGHITSKIFSSFCLLPNEQNNKTSLLLIKTSIIWYSNILLFKSGKHLQNMLQHQTTKSY